MAIKGSLLNLEIEATNLCNTRCLHCPREAISRPLGKMDWDAFQIILDKARNYSTNLLIGFGGMGEPLLNPLIYQFVHYAAIHGTTSLTTNLSALNSENARRLIDAGLGCLNISFNGNEAGLYESMMGGLDFDRAVTNLCNVIELRKGSSMQVTANISVTRQTEQRLAEIKAYLKEAGVDAITFSKCHSRGGYLNDPSVCTTPLPPGSSRRCDILKNTLFVAWTGQVLSCCHDLAGANVIGDLKTESLDTIQARIADVLQGGVKYELCAHCNDLYRYMDDQSPDHPISEWIYELYQADRPALSPEISDLSEWLFEIYLQEGQARKLVEQLSIQTHVKEQRLRLLEEKAASDEQALQQLRVELQSIQTSRTWQLLQKIHRVRRFFIPPGSRRDALFQKVTRNLVA
ncbi:MAG: radical SAM/SPASM domain-containing protein [Omnitrophica WOR_2 bacterium]